ncbi:hypothetical protein BDN72DRAFT_366699 [Pluteus cervinus]|uniref:Uncharacterized protein n=1 Tax=Pluteus cervinus TaxID=181527 RepID=A0ACD3BCN4_9AGAR|nr:hypothetical protein BDN72DRAFT_366699 [Pluteus cervinus]
MATDLDAPHAGPSESEAPEKALPRVPFYSIEYPGYVKSTSVPAAIETLGGQKSIDNAFKRTTSKAEALLELAFDPTNPFAHPVPGEAVATNNLLLKVVKRKRRKKSATGDPGEIVAEYTAEIVGTVPRTVRFRSMVDFQYQPETSDPISELRLAMRDMDVDAIRQYVIPKDPMESTGKATAPDTATPVDMGINLDPQLVSTPPPIDEHQAPASIRSNLRLFPPPLFSRQAIPQAYNFKANPASMVSTTVDEETGEERKRLVNRMRWKGYGPASIMFTDTNVPNKPPQSVEEGRSQANGEILIKLHGLFLERPIWTRMSLLNQFTPFEAREITNSKIILPLVCYVFQDGPWRDTLVRFDYDPRKDQKARFYQRLYFRNANHPIARPSVVTRRQERTAAAGPPRVFNLDGDRDADRKNAHIFDGQTITKETAAFQLCDITDPMLKGMIEEADDLRESCDERDGWYSNQSFERIKTVLRHKFFSLLEGHVATDEECRALLAANEGNTKAINIIRNQRIRTGKHNMAKGAMRPEDAAAVRLRAALDRNAKTFLGRR